MILHTKPVVTWGPKLRKYADNSGNPIGKASLKAFYDKNKRQANNDELTAILF